MATLSMFTPSVAPEPLCGHSTAHSKKWASQFPSLSARLHPRATSKNPGMMSNLTFVPTCARTRSLVRASSSSQTPTSERRAERDENASSATCPTDSYQYSGPSSTTLSASKETSISLPNRNGSSTSNSVPADTGEGPPNQSSIKTENGASLKTSSENDKTSSADPMWETQITPSPEEPKGTPTDTRGKQALSGVLTPALATAVESPVVETIPREWSPLAAAAIKAQRGLLPALSDRPPSVRRSLEAGLPVRHFAFGSNLSLQKLQSRVPGGIQPLALQPAMVKGHRLAFNLAGFTLVEPTMASIEPMMADSAKESKAGSGGEMKQRREPEIHGLLLTLRPEEYDLLYISEGGAAGRFRAYLEYEITAVTYNGEEFKAVALRANPESRGTLARSDEQLPSRRYLSLIIRGAKERGLDPYYVAFLERRLAGIRDPLDIFG